MLVESPVSSSTVGVCSGASCASTRKPVTGLGLPQYLCGCHLEAWVTHTVEAGERLEGSPCYVCVESIIIFKMKN